MKKYFSYSGNAGFQLHETLEESLETAKAELSEERQAALVDGEWYDEAKDICCGELTHLIEADVHPNQDGIVELNLVEASEK